MVDKGRSWNRSRADTQAGTNPGSGAPPPSDPALPTDIVLEPGHTEFPATLTISKPRWPAGNHMGTGVGCASSVAYHIHALLSICQDRQRLALPDSIGRGGGCNYEMHMHDGPGVMHIESAVSRTRRPCRAGRTGGRSWR